MRDPTPQEIEMVHRMHDAGRLIVGASRLRSSWPNEAVANGHEKVCWLATVRVSYNVFARNGDYT
jgi:hypothetical protein